MEAPIDRLAGVPRPRDAAGGGRGTELPAGVAARVPELVALRQRVAALRVDARRRSHAPRAAQEHSPFRGRGMEYAESRPYSPGDDARHVDWRVSARTGQLHSKLFHAERERLSAVVYDAGPWMAFGTRHCFKGVQAARLAALFAWLAQAEGDRVALACNRAADAQLPPAAGERGVLRLLAQLCRWQALPGESARATLPLSAVLSRLERLLRPGSRILLVVDPHGLDEPAMRRLRHLRIHHDLLVALLVDPVERRPPSAAALPVSDGRETRWIGGTGRARTGGHEAAGLLQRCLEDLHRHAISARAVSPAEPPDQALAALLRGALFEEAM